MKATSLHLLKIVRYIHIISRYIVKYRRWSLKGDRISPIEVVKAHETIALTCRIQTTRTILIRVWNQTLGIQEIQTIQEIALAINIELNSINKDSILVIDIEQVGIGIIESDSNVLIFTIWYIKIVDIHRVHERAI